MLFFCYFGGFLYVLCKYYERPNAFLEISYSTIVDPKKVRQLFYILNRVYSLRKVSNLQVMTNIHVILFS